MADEHELAIANLMYVLAELQAIEREDRTTGIVSITSITQQALADAKRNIASYNLVSVPVVDEKHRLVGVVTIDDILDHLLPDDWRSQDEDEPVKPPSDETGSIRIVNGRRGGSGTR